MNPILKNVLAVVAGVVVCMLVNGGIISLSAVLIPPPAGVNVSDMESVRANMHLFQPKHFILPFLAHALGSLFGGLVAALIATTQKIYFAFGIGVIHMFGGLAAALLIPAPSWFVTMDIVVAYLPMAWLGGKLAGGRPAAAQM